jgi:hypothetical protein
MTTTAARAATESLTIAASLIGDASTYVELEMLTTALESARDARATLDRTERQLIAAIASKGFER